MQAKVNLLAALRAAGYVAFEKEFPHVVEFADRFTFAVEDAEGQYMIGTFYKATATRKADYAGCPDVENLTLRQAMDILNPIRK